MNKNSTLLMMIIAGVITTPAFAYIDPASGSAIMSAVIGAIVALGLTIKGYWYKLKGLFTRSVSTASGTADVGSADGEDIRNQQ